MKIVELILSSFRDAAKRRRFKKLSLFEKEVLAKRVVIINISSSHELRDCHEVQDWVYLN